MSMVHDNVIQSYMVDFEADTLTINTSYLTDKINEKTKVIYTGYLAHIFVNEMKGSMIFDIQECLLDHFIKREFILLKQRQLSGWPISYETESELIMFFQTHEYKIYEISSSYGLCGWVFAKQMDIVVNEQSVNITSRSKIYLP